LLRTAKYTYESDYAADPERLAKRKWLEPEDEGEQNSTHITHRTHNPALWLVSQVYILIYTSG